MMERGGRKAKPLRRKSVRDCAERRDALKQKPDPARKAMRKNKNGDWGTPECAMRYSAAGNMIYENDALKRTEKNMHYNADNRIVCVTGRMGETVGEYDYDDTGFRVRKYARYVKDGVERSKETITPSMYFSYEKDVDISTRQEKGKTYAVSHIYLNGVRIAASPARKPSVAAPNSRPS